MKELVVREHYPVGHIAELWKMFTTRHSDKSKIWLSFIKSHLYCLLIRLAVKEVLAPRI